MKKIHKEKCYIQKITFKTLPAYDNAKAIVVEKQQMFLREINFNSCEMITRKSVIYGIKHTEGFLRVKTQRYVVLQNTTEINIDPSWLNFGVGSD